MPLGNPAGYLGNPLSAMAFGEAMRRRRDGGLPGGRWLYDAATAERANGPGADRELLGPVEVPSVLSTIPGYEIPQRPLPQFGDPEPRNPLIAALARERGFQEERQQQAEQQQTAMRAGVLQNMLALDENRRALAAETGIEQPPLSAEEIGLRQQLMEAVGIRTPNAARNSQMTQPVALEPPKSLASIIEEVDTRIKRSEGQERRQAPVKPELQAILSDPEAVQMLLQMRNMRRR